MYVGFEPCEIKAIDWLWKNLKQVAEKFAFLDGTDCPYFDYPDYAGLPISISSKLDSDFVDFIQSIWWEHSKDYKKYRTCKQWLNSGTSFSNVKWPQ